MTPFETVLATFLVLNVITFFVYGVDKGIAVSNRGKDSTETRRRTPEKTLLILAALAPFGATAGMKAFHHKTRKPKFKLVYVFLLIHLTLLAVWLFEVI